MSDPEAGNYDTFRECIFAAIADKYSINPSKSSKRTSLNNRRSGNSKKTRSEKFESPATDSVLQSSSSELLEFSDYIAREIFPELPHDLQQLSYQHLIKDERISEKWSLPLSLGVFEELASGIPPHISDSLISYGLVEPPESDVQTFITTVIVSFIKSVTTRPPTWISTKPEACEICDRDWIPLTYHHLIPKQIHAKVLKRGWHEEEKLNSVAWLCRACHSFVHKMASNEELAQDWYTVEKINSREDVQKWALWIGRVRWKKT